MERSPLDKGFISSVRTENQLIVKTFCYQIYVIRLVLIFRDFNGFSIRYIKKTAQKSDRLGKSSPQFASFPSCLFNAEAPFVLLKLKLKYKLLKNLLPHVSGAERDAYSRMVLETEMLLSYH